MSQSKLQTLTLGQILDRTVAVHPERDALIYVDRDFRLTYSEFARMVDQLAKGLMALGVKKGEKVAVWATNIPYWVTLQFATAKIGAVLLTVNTNYKTAELAYLLEQSDTETFFLIDGYLAITGRSKDMIIRGGENIYPREIEEFLFGLEGIMDVQVVGIPSKKYGEEVGAFIIPREGTDITESDVKDYCRGQIARYKIPKYVAFVKDFPLTASGKVQKYKLQESSLEYFPEADPG